MSEHSSKPKDKPKHHKKDKKRKRHTSPLTEPPKKARIEIDRSSSSSGGRTSAAGASSGNNPYHMVTASLYLSLAPRYSYYPEKTFPHLFAGATGVSSEQAAHMRSLSPLTGVQKHHLDPLLMTYYEPVDGVVLAYDNIRFETRTAKIIAEAPYAYVWTMVDLLVWRPTKDMVVQGWVNLQSASHIGLLVDNTWNVSIPFARIPDRWRYSEAVAEAEDADETPAEGAWLDEKGGRVEGLLRFVVESVKAGGSIFIMEGSLLDREKIESAVMP